MRTPLRVLVVSALLTGLTIITPTPAHADEIRDAQWYLAEFHVRDAHKLSTGAGVRIGVVDTGVAADHPDLAGAVNGSDFVAGAGDPLTDPADHGTAIAAVAAGRNDSDGVLGVAPDAEVVSVGLDPGTDPATLPELLPEAITALLQDRVDIIMVTAPVVLPPDLPEIDNPAIPAGVPVVVNAGVPLAGAITVVGTDHQGQRWQSTPPLSPGADFVVAAPAVDIPHAGANGEYTPADDDLGYATAMVAGSLALLKARWPQIDGDLLRELLAQHGTVGVPEGNYDDQLGFGMVDPGKLLQVDVPGLEPVDPLPPGGTGQGGGDRTETVTTAIDTSAAHGTLASIIAVAGLALLAAMVVVTRTVDARMRRRPVAPGGSGSVSTVAPKLPTHPTGTEG